MILDILGRYWAKVDRRGPDECWRWKGARTEGGYGQIAAGSARRGRPVRVQATHVALAIDDRPRPGTGYVAMHQCDNPLCVNPAHLSWGTTLENMRDMHAKERSGAHRKAAALMDANAQQLGMTAGKTKLNEGAVRYIRSTDKRTCDLAREFDVTWSCIDNVRRRKTWADLL